ncbi:MAG TPA: S8 family serine peptidase, partial [Burkholderiales bacterium]|nr:S8 family serine peptidase [Burkholderiales bacterium]
MKIRVRLVALIAAACLNACGGGGGGGDNAPTPTFTVGGTVSGLTGAGLVLELNGGSDLNVAADGPFNFPGPVPAGTGFIVTVLSQPAAQTCGVSGGSGTVPASNVSNVAVICTDLNGFAIALLNDPLVGQQWHLKNTGQKGFADVGGAIGIDVDVDPVYGLGYTGAGVTVAVVDSGLEIAHEDLAANVLPGGSWNFNNGTTDPTNTTATTGDHGTSVSGLIAMAMNNAKGGIGVAPRAKLKGFNFLSSTQSESQFLDSLGASSSNPNSSDVFIFNQSFGIDTNTPTLVDPQDEAQYLAGVTSLRGGKGAVYVKAAGNGFNAVGPGLVPPACGPTGLTCENANFDPANTLPYQVIV